MYLPKAATAILALRQASTIVFPAAYCSPQCPSCRTEVANFDGATTSCVANSSFITNCGACQQCILTYNVETGRTEVSTQMEVVMINIINLCNNTTVSPQVSALQSQASRISRMGVMLASATLNVTVSITSTAQPLTTSGAEFWRTVDSNNPSFQSVLATATWAPEFSSWKAAASTSTATPTSSSTSIPLPAAGSAPSLNTSWIAGPVIGSILGLCTVIVVIFFTRRRHMQAIVLMNAPAISITKDFNDTESIRSQPSKPQLHSECVEARELENCEVVMPAELPALEPVGSEMSTPRDERTRCEEDWPLPVSPMPMSPLPLLFAMSEWRDERAGVKEGPKHETFYHP
ncbi:hypothetical protein VTL71DRAFT_14014 [Oculimacula yallundae]|uniref:Uncharacterized protein n=1 Tax=Oculimacula yallundae TaxID=86028 RepID=A0ABR4CNU2_9HELO